MESEQWKKTEETHLLHKICILKDSVNNNYSQLSAGQSLITLAIKKLLALWEQFVEKKSVVDNAVVDLETNDIPSNLTLKIGSYDCMLYLKSVDEKADNEFILTQKAANEFILTQYGGETKDGERKNDNTRNDGGKAESNQTAGEGGAQGLSGFMSTSTSGSSSGGDGGDGKGGNDDWKKTLRDLLVEVDPEEEEAKKNEDETREIEKEIEKKEETKNAEHAGQDEDDDVCRQEKTRHSNQSCSSVIITDLGLSPDPRNMIRRWPQNLQKALKGVLYWVFLSFQRSMTLRALVQRHGLLQHPVTCISQTTNCIRTMLSPSLCLGTLDQRVFTVSATLLPTGCLLPCPWSSITAILTVTQPIQELQQIQFIQTNAGSGLSEMSQSILSFETPILGDTFRNMQRSALRGASHMVNVIHPRTAVFMKTELLTKPTLLMADSDNFPCQQRKQHQKDMQGETAHQPRQTQPMAATDNTPRLQQPQVWAAPFKATSKVDSQSQIMTKSSAEKSLPSILRAPISRQVGALRQTRRSYIPVDHSCLEQHFMLKQAQFFFLQQHQANKFQNEPLPLGLNTVSAFMPFECDASDDARHPSAAGQVVNPNDIGVHHPSLNSTDFPVSHMDSVVGQRANQHPKDQQVWYSGQPHSSAKFRSASGSNVSPVRGCPGPPNLSSQDQSGNRERHGVQDYRAAQQSILSNAERVGGPPNQATGFDFSSTIMGLQPNSPHAESRSSRPGTVRGLGGFPFEPGDQNEHENRAQDFSQAQHRPQRGGRRKHHVFPQCSEDLASSPNSSSDHDVNERRQETTGGLRSSQQQHLTNQREMPFPTQCQEHVHRDPANPSAASNHGEVPHDNANGRPAQQGPPAPNNDQVPVTASAV